MNVKAFISIANRSLQNTMAYRTSYILTFASNFIGFIATYALWHAIFDGREQLAGLSWEQMKAYLLITFITNALLSWYSETRIANKILDGSVAADLLKPLDFQQARFAETLGSGMVEGGLAAILITVVMIITSGVMVPHTLVTWVLFVLSLMASLVVKFGVVYIAGLLCFWSTGSLGIIWARIAVTNLLSGALVPLVFFPHWLEKIAMALPFKSIVYTPTVIYMEQQSPMHALGMVGMQWVWAIVLWLLGKLMWNRAVRKITIHGG